MAFENIIVEKKEEGIIKITLNRPQVLNALNNASGKELLLAFEEINRDENATVVILTGAGRAFCTGRDLKTQESSSEGDHLVEAIYFVQKLQTPVIAAVHGYAIAGGFELALACDLVIAAEDAIFRDTHAGVGLIPGAGNSQRLPRLVGEKKAKEILFTTDSISAIEAEKIGLINRVAPTDKLEEEVMLLAGQIAAQPKHVIRKIKQMVDEGMKMDFNAAMMFERLENRTWRDKMSPEEMAQLSQSAIKKKAI